jgi:hypothetical protein
MRQTLARWLAATLLFTLLAGCATGYGQPEGVRATQAMTDMDGRPIDVGPGSGLSFGFGSWGRHGGVGLGIGPGW